MILATFATAFLLQIQQPKLTVLSEGLGLRTPANRRSPVRLDPVENLIVTGAWELPKDGNQLGGQAWAASKAGADGAHNSPATRGGYLWFSVDSERKKVVWLHATGASTAYINLQPRAGDPYSFGYLTLPLQLEKGKNELLFATGRGGFSGTLEDVPKPILIDLADATLPDIVEGMKLPLWAGIVVRNATESELRGLSFRFRAKNGRSITQKLGTVPAMSCRKLPVEIPDLGTNSYDVELMLRGGVLDTKEVVLRTRKPQETHKRTFVSQVDGSVQYFGVQPSSKPGKNQALILSLHGAGVEGMGQAEAYGQKDWANLVAATNRRPFGFDWEDIGRLDALEVLKAAKEQFQPNLQHVYLTGHSMGGHGTWQVGAHFPDQFAGIAPSAGWISFFTYGGGVTYPNPTPMESMLLRATNASQTLLLKQNYLQEAIYIIHGDADDNVPVTQARQMREELKTHPNLKWHEQPGAGHWWDASPDPGADCVDWKPMFDWFKSIEIPKSTSVSKVDFTTISPGISSSCHWLSIEQQEKSFEPSHAVFTADSVASSIVGTTENIACFKLDFQKLGTRISKMVLNGITVTVRHGAGEYFVLSPGGWKQQQSIPSSQKCAARSGGFKDVFRNRVVFVYGTSGSEDENRWAKSKAVFDAETLWYRGNGSAEICSDSDFSPQKYSNRNVLLYGTSATNSAYNKLIRSPDIEVQKGQLRIGTKKFLGNSYAVAFVTPRKDSTTASVGVLCGTGIVGMRLCDRLPIFGSGAGIPDLIAYQPSMLTGGTKGVIAAGYFGNDWSVASGQFEFQD